MINVTKSYLPSIDKYKSYIDKIYENGILTNSGPLVHELEQRLKLHLGVENLVLVANGTVALEIAYRALDIVGYAITTPFSFVATTSSLVTNNISPIFCDIDESSLNIDPDRIENLITPNTSAIVPVHVFGNPCDVEKIQSVADEYGLKVIYDAAHAFDVEYKGKSILNYGDISTLSFHATKLFHSIEGGALIFRDKSLEERVRYLINFGIKNKEEIPELGTNAKMNEFEAAMGLCVLDDIEEIKSKRKFLCEVYQERLRNIVSFQEVATDAKSNFSYFPVVFESEDKLLEVENRLNSKNIFPRRYFYPSLDKLSYIEPKQHMPISRSVSSRVLCLPLYADLELQQVNDICDIICGCY
ncbi:DegT/DnrJ/EryC1/StrS family aminotransferase [Enterovibrio norvegicus]|uniref:DegT/DnrJ/EryC1/StrS family aminotransferase n=1 Tax=Enterovibrio norvegicus TaxID=188144 RepID=UPI0010BEF6EA|nr:DegT/DnrJ/EryC1/StrS family aminotransferase [Enterovibrio norvegicus]TKF10784.1 DegT/DnrJ/EryC1/StrS family aminotransferase [Enterovibrio norvegicus]